MSRLTILRSGVSAAVLSLLTLAGCGGGSDAPMTGPPPPPPEAPDPGDPDGDGSGNLMSDRIAFSRRLPDAWQLFSVATDGSDPVQLTQDLSIGGIHFPSWHPDGSRILFARSGFRVGNNFEFSIWSMAPDGSDLIPMAGSGATFTFPSWSPTGERYAFTSDTELSVAEADESDGTLLLDVADFGDSDFVGISAQAWWPDGEGGPSILFHARIEPGGEEVIRAVDPETGEVSSVPGLEEVVGDDRWAAVAPTDGAIAFSSTRDGGEDIYVLIPDGELRRLTDHPALDLRPAWSPDGEELAFFSLRDGNREIYVIRRDGTGLRNLTNDPAEDVAPVWSP